MAIISSHTLNGTDGTHASGIEVSLTQLGKLEQIAASQTDESGRVSIEIDPSAIDSEAKFELVLSTRNYWADRGFAAPGVVGEIVLRFQMPDTHGKYHMPVILSPHSYSTWKSG